MKIYQYLNLMAKKYPKKIAFISEREKITFSELKKKAENLAGNLIAIKIKPKQKVAILSNNSIDYIIIELACAIIDVVVVPISVSMAKKDIVNQIKFTDVKYVFLWHFIYPDLKESFLKINIKKNNLITIGKQLDDLNFLNDFLNKKNILFRNKNLKNKNGSNPFLIVLTSGSTSKPKAIVFSQKTKLLRGLSAAETYNIKKSDTLILATPLKQSISQRFIHLSLLIGCTTVVMENFSIKKWIYLVQKYKVTFSILVASQIKNLSNIIKIKDIRLKTIKKLVSCCAELDNQTKNKIIKKKNSANFYDTYGATEVGTVTNLNLSKFPLNRGSLGLAIKNVDIKILDKNNKKIKDFNKIGKIACKSKFVFSYYLKSNLKNKSMFSQYFKTGDLGYLDNEGMLHLTGREKDIIIVGGVNVFPEDIERKLDTFKDIKKSAVIGIKDKRLGEAILALILLKDKKKFDQIELKKFCIKNLSDYQQPHKFIILKKFPLGGYGKINKFKLKEKYKNIDLTKNLRAAFI